MAAHLQARAGGRAQGSLASSRRKGANFIFGLLVVGFFPSLVSDLARPGVSKTARCSLVKNPKGLGVEAAGRPGSPRRGTAEAVCAPAASRPRPERCAGGRRGFAAAPPPGRARPWPRPHGLGRFTAGSDSSGTRQALRLVSPSLAGSVLQRAIIPSVCCNDKVVWRSWWLWSSA